MTHEGFGECAAGLLATKAVHPVVEHIETLFGILAGMGVTGVTLAFFRLGDVHVVRGEEVLRLLAHFHLEVEELKVFLRLEPAIVHEQGHDAVVPVAVNRPVRDEDVRILRLDHFHACPRGPGQPEIDAAESLASRAALDLTKVKVPVYLQSAKEDHIAPFRSVYKATKLFKGPVRFIIAGSGHIAGVINPPAGGKYQYWTNDKLPATVEDWQAGAKEHPGSWWPDWDAWLSKHSGKKIPARKPGSGKLKSVRARAYSAKPPFTVYPVKAG